MSKTENLTEHTIQKGNLAAVDPNYLKLRLDTQKLHQDILNFLQGTRTVIEFDKKSETYYEDTEEIGDPLANKEGIQAILSFVIGIVNPHTIQGNTERKELYKILYNLDVGLSERLTVNHEKWGIDPDYMDHIIDTIMPMIHLILTRTIDNKEREGLGIGIEQIKNLSQPKEKGKVI